MKSHYKLLLVLLCLTLSACYVTSARAGEKLIGEVVTTNNLLGADNTIGVLRIDDPKIPNAKCYLAQAQMGGMLAGLAEDPSEFTLDCFTTGPITIPAGLPRREIISVSDRSLLFKKMLVARMVDPEAKRIVYVVYTRKLWDGSPKNAMSSLSYGQ